MKNKLGIIGAFILSLAIAGSALANSGTTTVGSSPIAQRTKNVKPRKHRKHSRAKRAMNKSAEPTKTTPPTP